MSKVKDELAMMAQDVVDSLCAYCLEPIASLDSAVRSDNAETPWAHQRCWLRHLYGTYETDDGREWINAPGACQECCAGQRGELYRRYGEGHFLCSVVPADILQAAEDGLIRGMLHSNVWRWY